MMLRWTGRTAVLAAVMLTTMIYAGPCQSQSYTAAAQNKSPQGLWVVNFNFFDEFQGESLKKSGSPKPTLGLTFPDCCPSFPALTFDKSGDLWVGFVADQGSGVGELTRNELNPSKKRLAFQVTLSYQENPNPLFFPRALAFDPAGDLWVATTARMSNLFEYTPDQLTTSGGPAPASTIDFPGTSGIQPHLILFDSAGDLWLGSQFSVSDGSVAVVEYTPAQIAEMQMGASPTPALTVKAVSGFGGLSAITFDERGNLWMAVPNTEPGLNGVNGGLVEMFNVAGKTGTLSQPDVMITPSAISSINQSLDEPSGLAFDDQGSLWVANRQSSDQISGSRNSSGFLVRFAADQISASGSPVPPTIISPNRKATNIDNPTTIIFGPTVK